MFGPNSVNVARYASLIGTKSPTKWDTQLTESNFQTPPSTRNRIMDNALWISFHSI
uniref:DUF6783 domain-containing protein n=1 Tax=Enterocloster aldenensis TaxID=358742 RepID=UPI003369CFE0